MVDMWVLAGGGDANRCQAEPNMNSIARHESQSSNYFANAGLRISHKLNQFSQQRFRKCVDGYVLHGAGLVKA